jgi:hypothetical protein
VPKPQVAATDAVHSISGFFDRVVLHHEAMLHLAAFWTIRAEEAAGASELFHLTGSKPEDIDVVVPLDEADLDAMRRALDCYVTYAATVEESGIKRDIPREAVFEVYQEEHKPPLRSLVERLAGN